MPRLLSALIVEDSEDDATLLLRELQRGGFDVFYERVESAAAMRTALAARPWDVVIFDDAMPHFTRLEALKVMRDGALKLPLLLVSSVAAEDAGLNEMPGAMDEYLTKEDLTRLVPAVERELRQAEIRRERRETAIVLRLRTEALAAAANGVLITDANGSIIWVNAAVTALTGYSEAELLGQNLRILKSGVQDEAFYRNLWTTILEGQVWRGEIINRRKDGSRYTEEMTITPVLDGTGNNSNFIAIKQDVTERNKVQEALRVSETRYRRLFETAQDGILLLDSKTAAITDANPFLIKLLGYTLEEMQGKKLWEIGPFRDLGASRNAFQSLQEGGYIRYENLPLETKSGVAMEVEFVSNSYLADGKKVIQCNIRDITSRRQAERARDAHEKALSAALAAKQVLLQEVHHRVKNNLQIISSLLNLEAESLPEGMRKTLDDSGRRVRSMALVHEQLYGHEDLGELDFAEYTKSLATDLFSAYSVDSGKVRLRLELERALLGMDQAIPCGLILNELMTNSLKYAFPESRSGEILVELHSQANSQVTLRVADNGVGLPLGFDWKQSNSLGLRIVQILTRQIKGNLHYEEGAGCDFTLTFAKR